MALDPGRDLDAVRLRPGGRSARVRESVLVAVREQLAADGYSGLSPTKVAAAAGVDRVTVHRRWPTRARLVGDAMADYADARVPVPDAGSLRADLRAIADAVATTLRDPATLRLAAALIAASTEDPELQPMLQTLWVTRLHGVSTVLERAAARGELERAPQPWTVIDHLVGPLYFRALLTAGSLDEKLVVQCVDLACQSAATG